MNKGLNMLLRLAIAQGLTNREAFVEKVGDFLQQKMGQDKENADKYGEYIMNLLEGINEQLIFESVFESKHGKTNAELSKKIDQLTKAVEELSKKLEEKEK